MLPVDGNRPAHNIPPIGFNQVVSFAVADNQKLATRTDLIDIQTGFIGALQSLIEFHVEDLEAQAPRFRELMRVGNNRDRSVCHSLKNLTKERPLENRPTGVRTNSHGVNRHPLTVAPFWRAFLYKCLYTFFDIRGL